MCSEKERTIRLVEGKKDHYERKIHDIKVFNWQSAKVVQRCLEKINECEATLSKLREN
ncbi:MAG: hypothetical protein ACYS6K_12030 [Planctomycetota bacterium]|jgi:hypothetical protein